MEVFRVGAVIDQARFVSHSRISPPALAGGYNYQSNLFAALNRYCPGEIVPLYSRHERLTPLNSLLYRKFPASKSCNRPRLIRRRSGSFVALAIGIVRSDGKPNFRAKRIRSCVRSSRGFRKPGACLFRRRMVSGDFQHSRLRSCFRWLPDGAAILASCAQIASGRSIMLSSESARATTGSFIRVWLKTSSWLVRGRSPAGLQPTGITPSDILAQYSLPPGYFICRTSSGGTRIIRFVVIGGRDRAVEHLIDGNGYLW